MSDSSKIEVWLFSSKDVEQFYSENNVCAFSPKNTRQLNFFSNDNMLLFSLRNFYHDIINCTHEENSQLYYTEDMNELEEFKNEEEHLENIPLHPKENEDLKSIQEYLALNKEEKSESMIDSIFCLKSSKERELKDCRVFYTRCLPNKNEYYRGFQKRYNRANEYWILSYMSTVAKIVERNIRDIVFNLVFHDEDFGETNKTCKLDYKFEVEGDLTKELVSQVKEEKLVKQAYAFTHTPNNIYKCLIKNEAFFLDENGKTLCAKKAVKKIEDFLKRIDKHNEVLREKLVRNEMYDFDDERINLIFGIRNE